MQKTVILTLSSLGVCKRSRVRSDVKTLELPWASKYSSTMLVWLRGSGVFLLFLAGVLYRAADKPLLCFLGVLRFSLSSFSFLCSSSLLSSASSSSDPEGDSSLSLSDRRLGAVKHFLCLYMRYKRNSSHSNVCKRTCHSLPESVGCCGDKLNLFALS